jgi:hypothetical protein
MCPGSQTHPEAPKLLTGKGLLQTRKLRLNGVRRRRTQVLQKPEIYWFVPGVAGSPTCGCRRLGQGSKLRFLTQPGPAYGHGSKLPEGNPDTAKISKPLITVAIIAALSGTSGRLLGPQAAGPAFLVMCIIVGGYVGSGWGGRQAAKTVAYREELPRQKSSKAHRV